MSIVESQRTSSRRASPRLATLSPAAAPRATASRMVVVAERDPAFRECLCTALRELESPFVIAADFPELLAHLESHGDSVVLLDAGFHERGALTTLGLLHLNGHCPRVVLLNDKNSPHLDSPSDRIRFSYQLSRTSNADKLKNSVADAIRSPSRRRCHGTPIIGNSNAIKELRDVIEHVSETDASVMIIGESGTGKELVAQAIHDCSPRTGAGFVPVNMAALPDSLVESVLFGHEKGAFTGADSRQAGVCQHAHGGTLFLDEIGEMSRDLQPKLLRFLQNYTVQRVGSAKNEMVDTRIISATNRPVAELVQGGVLREDLFFRLHVIPIHVPALRDRKDDIPLLANAFLARNQKTGRRQLSFSSECLDLFQQYSWPGNIRQLENVVQRMAVMAKGEVIDAAEFQRECNSVAGAQPEGGHANSTAQGRQAPDCHVTLHAAEPITIGERVLTRMESAERRLIISALHQMDGNVSDTAAFLGVGSATVYRKIRTLEIPKIGKPATKSQAQIELFDQD